jgi:hypothetical protein
VDAAHPVTLLPGAAVDLGVVPVRKIAYYRVHVRIPAADCGPGDTIRVSQSQRIRESESGLAVGEGPCGGDWLVTGKDGRISLTFVDNTRFAVGPNSRISVSRFEYDKTRQQGSFLTQVDRGSLAIVSGKIAKSARDAMKVRTPNSLLGVRGTRFIVEVPK